MPNGSITLYAKEIDFEFDPDDGMVHVLIRANNMDVRVIQTRHFFYKSRANAERLGRDIAARDQAAVVPIGKPRSPRKSRDS